MQFNSIAFLTFLAAVVFLYYLLPPKFRRALLLGAGCYFYLRSEPLCLALLLVSTVIDYTIGLGMGKSKNISGKRYYLALSLVCNLGLLAMFKYLAFFSTTLETVLGVFDIGYQPPVLSLAAPLGISYYTFKKISYIIDIYRGQLEPEIGITSFALYVTFFPQVTAGPIDRGGDLLPQFRRVHRFDYAQVTGGLKLMAWGMFKKLVVADRLALLAGPVFDHPTQYQGPGLIMAVLFFSIQIYADFSGYSDMAIGMARVMGFTLTDNFDRPYSAVGIRDFWKRWHISLTTWLRDYLFLPIAYSASRRVKSIRFGNMEISPESSAYGLGVLCTMLLCGLWHGAAWTYVIWGGLHGLFMLLSFTTRRIRKRLRKKYVRGKWKPVYRRVRTLLTFALVSYLWIFFRANSLADAGYIATHLFSGPGNFLLLPAGVTGGEFGLALLSIAAMVLVHRLQPHDTVRNIFAGEPAAVRWLFYILLLLAIMNFGVFEDAPFIYAQF